MIGRSERKLLVLSGQAIKYDDLRSPTQVKFEGNDLIGRKF